jgi:hypothetical protein
MSGIQSIYVSAAQTYVTVGPQNQQSLQPFSNLDLTAAQRSQLRTIFSAAKHDGTSQADVQKQISAILSPAQQQTLASDLKARGGHSGHHPHGSDSSTAPSSGTADPTEPAASAPPGSSILDVVTNIQNQAVAAQSTIVENLQQQVLATNGNSSTG